MVDAAIPRLLISHPSYLPSEHSVSTACSANPSFKPLFVPIRLSLSPSIAATQPTSSLMTLTGTTGHQECLIRQLPQAECLKYFLHEPTGVRYDPHCFGGQCLLKGPRNRTTDEHVRFEL
jgi:hypothetical protein